MPILPAEPALFPEGLFIEAPDAEAPPRQWWVLHTRPQQEKSLVRDLHDRGIPFYLPLAQRRLIVRGRVKHSYLPLFPGYVFLLADRDQRVAALSTRRVVRSLEVHEQGRLWDDLRRLNRLIDSGLPISREAGFAPGDSVEIRGGPLMGLRGRILKSASGRRFVVQVNFIQEGASVLVEDWRLDLVHDDPRP